MPRSNDGLRAEISALAKMARAYALQETVGPLRGLARYVALGIVGAIAISLAVVLAALAAMRALQSETGLFDANWSFVPYLVGIAVLLVAIAVMGKAIGGKGRSKNNSENSSKTRAKSEQSDDE